LRKEKFISAEAEKNVGKSKKLIALKLSCDAIRQSIMPCSVSPRSCERVLRLVVDIFKKWFTSGELYFKSPVISI